MLEKVISGLQSLGSLFAAADIGIAPKRKNRATGFHFQRLHLLESIAIVSGTDAEVAMDLFLHDFYEMTLLDDYVEDRLEDGGTAAWYHIRNKMWFEAKISKAELGPWDVRKGFFGGLHPPKGYIPEERATAHLYISIDKSEKDILAAVISRNNHLPTYAFNYHTSTNHADVYLAHEGIITNRGTLPLSDGVKEIASQYRAEEK